MHLGNDVTFPVESMSLHGYAHGLFLYSRLPYFLSSSMQLHSASISCHLSSSSIDICTCDNFPIDSTVVVVSPNTLLAAFSLSLLLTLTNTWFKSAQVLWLTFFLCNHICRRLMTTSDMGWKQVTHVSCML